MCVHLSHLSQETALLAFVTPFPQVVHGFETWRDGFTPDDADCAGDADGVDDADAAVDGIEADGAGDGNDEDDGPGC